MNDQKQEIESLTMNLKFGNINGYFELLNLDTDNVIDIIKTFPDAIKENESTLIPQLWWGNLEDPEVIILGKNPSYIPSEDDPDNCNKEFRDFLRNNLKFSNRTDDYKLSVVFEKYKERNVIKKHWTKILDGVTNKDAVAVYNIFGYYKTTIEISDLGMSHIAKNVNIKNKIINQIINKPNNVYFLWKGTKKLWFELLQDGLEEKKKKKLFSIINEAHSLNEKNNRVPRFSEI